MQQELLGDGRAEELIRSIYRIFVTSPENRTQFAATLRNLADKRSPLLFHCTSGKDRTGWLSYLLLRALGVPETTATGDYLLSNDFRAAADLRTRDVAVRRELLVAGAVEEVVAGRIGGLEGAQGALEDRAHAVSQARLAAPSAQKRRSTASETTPAVSALR
ncbi:tyrosine-protein phosphatase [Streptomyces sp. NPDC050743]|uniref:tyrosine-protein phosphatase n=1 Tax=Streptomyces sp. NPDC050743 TaxID=3365634 RepID=UPI00378DB33C